MSALLSAVLLLGGCYKIDYVRNAPSAPGPTSSSWHHIGILALVEFSDPVQGLLQGRQSELQYTPDLRSLKSTGAAPAPNSDATTAA